VFLELTGLDRYLQKPATLLCGGGDRLFLEPFDPGLPIFNLGKEMKKLLSGFEVNEISRSEFRR
jgi:hypothetical protein